MAIFNMGEKWKKLPAVKNIHIGCLNCSTAAHIAPLSMIIAVGFGAAYVTKDGGQIYDGEQACRAGKKPKTVRSIELMARKDPDHDWRIVKFGPMHGETFQRQGMNKWVCIESNEGFA